MMRLTLALGRKDMRSSILAAAFLGFSDREGEKPNVSEVKLWTYARMLAANPCAAGGGSSFGFEVESSRWRDSTISLVIGGGETPCGARRRGHCRKYEAEVSAVSNAREVRLDMLALEGCAPLDAARAAATSAS